MTTQFAADDAIILCTLAEIEAVLAALGTLQFDTHDPPTLLPIPTLVAFATMPPEHLV